MNDVNTMLYACAKAVKSKLRVKLKEKRKPGKYKIPKWQTNVEEEIQRMRREMSILSEKKIDKDPKARKARKDIRKYKITSDNDIPNIKEELKEKSASKSTEGKTI